jgi:hypothetical protein
MVWVEKNKKFEFEIQNLQYFMDGETRKDFIQASELHSEYYSGTVEHCSSYSDARGVTALPPNKKSRPKIWKE